LRDFIAGAACLFTGLKLLPRRGVRPYVIVPGMLNVTLFSLAIFVAAGWTQGVIDRWLPDAWSWAASLLWVLFVLVVMAVVFFSFVLIGNLIGAPFNGFLAAAVERRLTGHGDTDTGGWREVLLEAGHAVAGELRKYVFFACLAVPCLLLLLIPGLNVLFPFAWLLLGAWMLALEYLDYPAGNHQVRFAELRRSLAGVRTPALGLGCAVMMMTTIPLVNFIAMPAAVAGATVFWLKFMPHKTPE
jgi:CysZ protein